LKRRALAIAWAIAGMALTSLAPADAQPPASRGGDPQTPGGVRADASAPAPLTSLDGLFATMARSPGLLARFHEEKSIALLVQPLRSDGTLHFDKKRGLARHTLSPKKQSVLRSGSTLTLWDGAKVETVPLQSSAPLRALAEAFSLLLAADRAGLEKSFSLGFHADGKAWRLSLVPTNADLLKIVLAIDLAGEDRTPRTLTVHEASGDVGTTTLLDVDLDKQYTEREAAAVFRVPPGSLGDSPKPPGP
jgi:hypothetical protein